MSKSLQNFYTLKHLKEKNYEPLALRMLVLQAHYRTQAHFTWENLQSAQNRLANLRAAAALRWQGTEDGLEKGEAYFSQAIEDDIVQPIQNDLDTPAVLARISQRLSDISADLLISTDVPSFESYLQKIDDALGLNLLGGIDISQHQKQMIAERETARQTQDWQKSDVIRAQLAKDGITVRDTSQGPIWTRL